MLIFIPAALTVNTVVKSKRLAEFLEALADERLTKRDKLNTLFIIWKKERHTSGMHDSTWIRRLAEVECLPKEHPATRA
jgi:hypothetical protein